MNFQKTLTSKAALVLLTSVGFLAAFSDPIEALAVQTYTMVGNYIITGNLTVNGLTNGQCIQAGLNGKLTSSGGACGAGGAVTAVTGSGNINSSGGTTPNITTVNSPTFSGTTTSGAFVATGSGFTFTANGTVSPLCWLSTSSSGMCQLQETGFHATPTDVALQDWGIYNIGTSIPKAGIDDSGNLGVEGYLAAGNLSAASGQCLTVAGSGHIVPTGSACGGGGGGAVSSVTAGPSANLTFSPTTGAVIGDIVGNPTFSGAVTSTGSGTSFVSTLELFGQWEAGNGNTMHLDGGGGLVHGVPGGGVSIADGVTEMMTINNGAGGIGNMGVLSNVSAGGLEATNLTVGQCLTSSVDGITGNNQIVSTGSACAAPYLPFTGLSTSQVGAFAGGGPNTVSNTSYAAPNLLVPAGTVIHSIKTICGAFNPTDAAGGSLGFYNPLDSNGLGGYSVNIAAVNNTFSQSAPNVIATIVIPSSPQAGPWVTSVTTSITPYTVQPDDSFTWQIVNADATTTQWVAVCSPFYN